MICIALPLPTPSQREVYGGNAPPLTMTEAKLLDGLHQTPSEDLAQERQRFAEPRQRFRVQSRSLTRRSP